MAAEKKDFLIGLCKVPLISSGLWMRPFEGSPILNQMFRYYSVLTKINYALFYVSLIAELLRLIIQGYSIQMVLNSLSICVNATKIAVKVIIYLKNNVLDLCEDIIDTENEMWRQNDPTIIKLYVQKIKMGKFFLALLSITTISVVAALDFVGAYGNLKLIEFNKANNESVETHYMYQFWFPANKLEHLNWVYVISFFESYAAITFNLTTHMVFITLLYYTASHLVLLQHRLRNFIPEDLNEENMDETIGNLKELIREHQYLIEYAEKINDRCKNIIMMEFILSSLDLASAAITMLKMKAIDTIWSITMIMLLVIQIFCLAYSCNEVNVESQAVADAIFESRWRLLNKDGKQLTQMLILRAQKPLMMTIGPFGPMTTQSFLTIIFTQLLYVIMQDGTMINLKKKKLREQ